MKIPNKLKIKKTDSAELKEIKQTLNDLLEFYYQWHNPANHHSCGTGCKHSSHIYESGGGC